MARHEPPRVERADSETRGNLPRRFWGTSYDRLLKTFWENHDPTQGMRQGNDVGTQYRSAIFIFNDAQRSAADASKAVFQKALSAKKLGQITTEVAPSGPFYFAEDYHQQYLAKNRRSRA